MKKIICALIVLVMTVSIFYGCGAVVVSNEEPETSFGEICFPSTGNVKSIPEIEWSTYGAIYEDGSVGLSMCVALTTKKDFAKYSDALYEIGFNVDYTRRDDAFAGYNEDGQFVKAYYVDNTEESIDKYEHSIGWDISEGRLMCLFLYNP